MPCGSFLELSPGHLSSWLTALKLRSAEVQEGLDSDFYCLLICGIYKPKCSASRAKSAGTTMRPSPVALFTFREQAGCGQNFSGGKSTGVWWEGRVWPARAGFGESSRQTGHGSPGLKAEAPVWVRWGNWGSLRLKHHHCNYWVVISHTWHSTRGTPHLEPHSCPLMVRITGLLWIPALPLTSCVTLGTWLNLSAPRRPHPKKWGG